MGQSEPLQPRAVTSTAAEQVIASQRAVIRVSVRYSREQSLIDTTDQVSRSREGRLVVDNRWTANKPNNETSVEPPA